MISDDVYDFRVIPTNADFHKTTLVLDSRLRGNDDGNNLDILATFIYSFGENLNYIHNNKIESIINLKTAPSQSLKVVTKNRSNSLSFGEGRGEVLHEYKII